MEYRFANEGDFDLLAHWNAQLINDEGHWNAMTTNELRDRMAGWVRDGHGAVVFSDKGDDVAYALYREGPEEVFLRQFFVRRDNRRRGVGRAAVQLLLDSIWPAGKRFSVSALVGNPGAVAFWRAMGFADFALTLTIPPRNAPSTKSSPNLSVD